MTRVNELRPLEATGIDHADYADARTVDWTVPGLKVTRLRCVTDPGFPFLDVSYCYGELDGEKVDVALPFHQLDRKRPLSDIVEHAKADGVYAKGLGILDVLSVLY